MASSRVVEPYLSGKWGRVCNMCTYMSSENWKHLGWLWALYPAASICILAVQLIHPSGLQSLFKYLITGSPAQAAGEALYALEAG